jgi:phenylacetate-CoA ligase
MTVSGNHQMLVSSYYLTADALPEILAAVRAFRPHAVEGWPSSLALLASRLREADERLPVDGIITSSEVMTSSQQALMRSVYGGPIIDHYGQTERVTMAGTCEHGGYHVFPDYGILEQVPVDGRPDRWEIVGTALHNWGYPLLRYRTGDEVGPAPSRPCACGRSFPLLGTIDGRQEDHFIAADGRIIPLPSSVIDDLDGLVEAQIVQLAQGRFEIRLVPGPDCNLAAVRARALLNVDQLIGPSQHTTIRVVDRIPRTASGKLKSAMVATTQTAAPTP